MDLKLKKTIHGILLLAFVLGTASLIFAQSSAESLIKDLKWRNVGPANMVGRISDFEALDNDFTQVLVASASGGVWKSVNAGTTWVPIFDNYGSASIGDVAFFQKDPNIIWVGTGEDCPRNSIAWGDGIYKSVDGGKTFKNMGLESTQAIGKVITHPTDPNLVFVAVAGHTWGYSGDRGLFKTEDGGQTWNKLTNGLPNDGKTGAVDLVMHPKNPEILYVGFWQRVRQPWRFDSGGPGSGIYKTTDSGKTWTKLTNGLPSGDLGRIGLAISRSNPDVLMAVVEHSLQIRPTIREGQTQTPNPEFSDMTKLGTGIYRSEDSGNSWKYMNRTNTRPFYYSHIYINPFDDKLVYYLTSTMYSSNDGGKTLDQVRGLHPDFHTMWLDPTNKNRFYVGQDGGASITHDGGNTWIFFDNLCVTQFYAVSADMRDPYYVYGGMQDNGTWTGPSMSREGSILTDAWYNIGGGDGFYTQNDPTDWRIAYCESQGGSISRVNVETRETTRIRPSQQNTYNWSDHVPKPAKKKPAVKPQQAGGFGRPRSPFRFNWSSPILISPHNPRTIYFAGDHLFKSVDRGDHWQIISPDLSTNDPEKHSKPTGGITLDQTGAETHCTITSISESPITPGIIWVGTDDGNVQVTQNDGGQWTNVRGNVPDVPEGIWVSRVEASRFKDGTCYLTFDGHRSDNFKPFVFKTTDYGQKWTDLGLNMPTVAFHDLQIHPRDNDLIAGTHGRGIWILDDISPLQQASEKVLESEAFLFDEGKVGTHWLRLDRGGYGRGNLFFQGENPPDGATISFYLKDKSAGPVTLEITDATGTLKTTYTLKNAEAGISRLMWDMRFDPSPDQMKQSLTQMQSMMDRILDRPEVEQAQKATVEKALEQLKQPGIGYREAQAIQRKAFETIGFGGGRGFRGFGRGGGAATAQPGTYGVKLTVNGKVYSGKVLVRQDPKLAGGNN